jgi:hypothetical protein
VGRIIRTVVAAGCGFVAGLAVGPASVLMAAVSDTLMRGWAWPDMNAKYALLLLATSVPAGVNAAVGAALTAGWGSCQRLGISLLPAALHAVAAVGALAVDVREFLLLQLMALMFSVVIWPAGRLGQLIGAAFRRGPSMATLDTAPPS